jgi:hypothetical protein
MLAGFGPNGSYWSVDCLEFTCCRVPSPPITLVSHSSVPKVPREGFIFKRLKEHFSRAGEGGVLLIFSQLFHLGLKQFRMNDVHCLYARIAPFNEAHHILPVTPLNSARRHRSYKWSERRDLIIV